MIVLANTTDKIQIVLSGAITTNQLKSVANWRDITATAYSAGRTLASSNDTTDVDIVGAPAASTQRVIDMINIHNSDTVSATVTVKYDASGVEYVLCKKTLNADQILQYHDGTGWIVR